MIEVKQTSELGASRWTDITATAVCPAGTVLLGGGGKVEGQNAFAFGDASSPYFSPMVAMASSSAAVAPLPARAWSVTGVATEDLPRDVPSENSFEVYSVRMVVTAQAVCSA